MSSPAALLCARRVVHASPFVCCARRDLTHTEEEGGWIDASFDAAVRSSHIGRGGRRGRTGRPRRAGRFGGGARGGRGGGGGRGRGPAGGWPPEPAGGGLGGGG